MPSRAYVAHDQAVSVVRMYLQMAVIGLIVGTGLYCALMAAFFSHWVSGPIPELREVDGRSRLVITLSSPRLPLSALVKYYVSVNPANYVSTNLNPSRQGPRTELEQVEKELLPLLQTSKVPRDQYRRFVWLITRGRVNQLRWIVPCSLLFFPVFGVLYFLAFRSLNKRASQTRFVRGADMVPLHQMKHWLQAAIEEEKAQKQGAKPLQLGAVLLPEEVSRRHIFMAGTSGTGKSACLNHYIRSLNQLKVSTMQPSKCWRARETE